MKLSILVCTWNRAALVTDTVHSILAATVPTGVQLELLVVDNASTDSTYECLRPLINGSDVRYILEPEPGLSFARNTGLASLDGDWIFFLDDDVLIEKDYFESYLAAIEKLPQCTFWAAPVVPVFESETRPWIPLLTESHPWCFSAIDFGGRTRELLPGQLPFGANMCIHRSIASMFRFDVRLGFAHGGLIAGEETAFFKAAVASGHVGGWNPASGILHRMPARRSELSYLLRRASGQGLTSAIDAVMNNRSSYWLLSEIPRNLIRFLVHAFRLHPSAIGHLVDFVSNVQHARHFFLRHRTLKSSSISNTYP